MARWIHFPKFDQTLGNCKHCLSVVRIGTLRQEIACVAGMGFQEIRNRFAVITQYLFPTQKLRGHSQGITYGKSRNCTNESFF